MNNWEALRTRLLQTLVEANFSARIKLTFEDGRNMLLIVGQGPLTIEEDSTGPVACEFKATLAHALDLFNRKLSTSKAMMTGKLKVGGDLSLALKVGDLLRKPLPAE